MLPTLRRDFNDRQFSPARYADLLARLDQRTRTRVGFRVCETPVFLPPELLHEMVAIGRELTHQLIDSPDYMKLSDQTLPELYRVPHDNPRPNFMTVDFGLVRDEETGEIHPKLVELQAFPSVYAYQELLCQEYVRTYELGEDLEWRLGGLTESGYWDLLQRTIVGDHAPENVVLMEVEPDMQKTLADFNLYEDRLGVRTVDLAKLRKQGNRLHYERDGVWTPIERVFNRAIVDEIERRKIQPAFDYRDALDVEWAGHPNWYFRISKFSLPYLKHKSVPAAVFLDDWMNGLRDGLPKERDQLLLKPLYSFAGKGILFSPTDEDLASIPVEDRRLYLLQERVKFSPVIETPFGLTQAEVRIMYCWPEGEADMIPATSLVRLGRGAMMGVDHNRNEEWIGGSAAMFPKWVLKC